MGVIWYEGAEFLIQEADAQQLTIIAARYTALGKAFTVRIVGDKKTPEQWLNVTPGVGFRVECDRVPSMSNGSPYSDRLREILEAADDDFNVVLVVGERPTAAFV